MFHFFSCIKQLNPKHKSLAFFLFVLLCLCITGICLYNILWLPSLLIACMSYLIIMIVTIRSIAKKITQKVTEAEYNQIATQSNLESSNTTETTIENLHTSTSHNTTTHNAETPTNKKNEEYRKKMKFIDLSKISLGFELSFSLPRVFAFVCMLLGFVVLVTLKLFYPIAYLIGISIGVYSTICYLLIESWGNNTNK